MHCENIEPQNMTTSYPSSKQVGKSGLEDSISNTTECFKSHRKSSKKMNDKLLEGTND